MRRRPPSVAMNRASVIERFAGDLACANCRLVTDVSALSVDFLDAVYPGGAPEYLDDRGFLNGQMAAFVVACRLSREA